MMDFLYEETRRKAHACQPYRPDNSGGSAYYWWNIGVFTSAWVLDDPFGCDISIS
jgi:hypothetical protein